MSEAPKRIWATEDAANFGEDAFHTTRPMGGLTEYVRSDLVAESMTWQPIATAPKDCEILVWTPDDGAFVAFWINMLPSWRWTSHDLGGDEVISPTYWMPLPAPPEND